MTAIAVTDEEADPEEVAWAFHPDRASWTKAGFKTAAMANSWIARGFTLDQAQDWASTPFTAKEAEVWRDSNYDSDHAAAWWNADFKSPDEADPWRNVGVNTKVAKIAAARNWEPKEAARWVQDGWANNEFQSAVEWRDAGWKNPREAKTWHEAFSDPTVALCWRSGRYTAKLARRMADQKKEPPPLPTPPARSLDRPTMTETGLMSAAHEHREDHAPVWLNVPWAGNATPQRRHTVTVDLDTETPSYSDGSGCSACRAAFRRFMVARRRWKYPDWLTAGLIENQIHDDHRAASMVYRWHARCPPPCVRNGSPLPEIVEWLAVGASTHKQRDESQARGWQISDYRDPVFKGLSRAWEWDTIGYSPTEARLWVTNGFADPEAAWPWNKVGLNGQAAHAWKTKAGLDGNDAALWTGWFTDPDEAKVWAQALTRGARRSGRTSTKEHPSVAAGRFESIGVSPESAAGWLQYTRDCELASTLAAACRADHQIAGSLVEQFGVKEAIVVAKEIGSTESLEWAAVGVRKREGIEALTKAGVSPEQVTTARNHGSEDLMVACQSEVHHVRVTWKNARPRWAVANHDVHVEHAAIAFNGEPLPCMKVLIAAQRTWRQGLAVTPGAALLAAAAVPLDLNPPAVVNACRWSLNGDPTSD